MDPKPSNPQSLNPRRLKPLNPEAYGASPRFEVSELGVWGFQGLGAYRVPISVGLRPFNPRP